MLDEGGSEFGVQKREENKSNCKWQSNLIKSKISDISADNGTERNPNPSKTPQAINTHLLKKTKRFIK
jgi:hypothetical protein